MSNWPSSTWSRASAPRPPPPTLRRSPISLPVRRCCRKTRWERRHELTFALELHRAECEFLTGALAEAEQRLAALSTRAANTVERATVACLRADLYTTLDQSSRAIAVGLDYLRHLGIDWSPHPTEEEARREYERIWSQLGSRTIEVSDRSALDERPGVPRDAGRSDQDRAACILYGCEPACPGHLPSGQSQPRARQLRRFVRRLCMAWHGRRPALRRLSGRLIASVSSATTWSKDAD